MLCIFAWERCYWFNTIMCKRKKGCQERMGKWCVVATWLYYIIITKLCWTGLLISNKGLYFKKERKKERKKDRK